MDQDELRRGHTPSAQPVVRHRQQPAEHQLVGRHLAKAGRTGSTWQVATVQALQAQGLTRPQALAEMLRRYVQRMHSNEPVHTWD